MMGRIEQQQEQQQQQPTVRMSCPKEVASNTEETATTSANPPRGGKMKKRAAVEMGHDAKPAAVSALDIGGKSVDCNAKAAAMLALDISHKSEVGERSDESAPKHRQSPQQAITATDPRAYRSMPLTAAQDTPQLAEARSEKSRSAPLNPEPTVLLRNQVGHLHLGPGAYSVEGILNIPAANDDEESVSKPFSMADLDDLSTEFSYDALDASLVSDDDKDHDHHQADLIDLEEALDVEAVPNQDKKEDKEEIQQTKAFSPRHRLMLKGICLIWVLGLTIGLLSRGSESRERQKDRPTRAHETSGQSEVIQDDYPPYDEEALLASTLRQIRDDKTSPQYKANAWLLQDPSFDQFTPLRKRQRFGLAAKYYATSGDSWFRNDYWLAYNSHVSECDWFGITCDNEGRVIYRDLPNNSLNGTLVQEAQLPYLRRSNLSNNDLHGMFPVLVPGRLDLEEFILSNNHFVGPIVVAAGMSAPDLRIVKLDGNHFEGNIHIALPLFPQLEIWNVTRNMFEGTLPTEVQHTLHLEYLGLGHNLFYGSVPSELGLLTALKDLDLSGNLGVDGPLPEELGSLASSLEYMDISETGITGDIPWELCQKQKAGELEIRADCSLVQCCD